jgi:hypothetical protein
VQPNGNVVPLRSQPGTGQFHSEGVALDGVEFKSR